MLGELAERGVDIRLVVHPVFAVERDAAGHLVSFQGSRPTTGGALRESFIHIHVERIDDEARRAEIVRAIADTLADVRAAVQDWRAMRARIGELIEELKTNPPPLPVGEIAEAIQFLEWLVADNFTFLGIRNYQFTAGGDALEPVLASGLGVLRARGLAAVKQWDQPLVITPEIRALLDEPTLLIVTKSSVRSRVHRRVYMDYVGVKRFDPDGKLIGEFRIVGLLTSTAYTRSTRSIPYLRRKVEAVVTRAGFDLEGHSGKALVNVLENYPRDELFQIDEDTLHNFALTVLQLDERPRVRVLPRRDRFDRFVSVLVYVPRDRYGSGIRKLIGDYLADAYKGRVSAFHPFFPEGPLIRVHFIIGSPAAEGSQPDRASLERGVEAIVRTWTDELAAALAQAYDPVKARALLERYREAFSDGYRAAYPPATAVNDIRVIEGLSAARPLGVDFHRRPGDDAGCIGLKVWSYRRPIPLSERVPVLENMGFRVVDELTYEIKRQGEAEASVWFHDMVLERADGGQVDVEALKQRLEACFLTVMTGGAESDGYNALVLAAGLMWRDVALIRTISRFLRQIRVPYSQDYMWATLIKHAAIAADVVRSVPRALRSAARPRPTSARRARRELMETIEAALQKVESLDEDRILRHFVNAVQAAIRTNFYQLDADGQPKSLLAVKFASRRLDGLPLPKPLYEIFVYSPRVEGVHLRFGKVARGGIRWSDRPQDFRTEVLGLVKAQQVKNAVIVPVGAKGGFVPKLLPRIIGVRRRPRGGAGRGHRNLQAVRLHPARHHRQYRRRQQDHPARQRGAPRRRRSLSGGRRRQGHGDVLRHRQRARRRAPFLARAMRSRPAARPATTTRRWASPRAAPGNRSSATSARWTSISARRRSRWSASATCRATCSATACCAKRPSSSSPPSTTATSSSIPQPDPDTSFAERKRLFELPRSSWQDYDKSLISQGGGVFSRALKEITLSPQAQAAIGFAKARATPQEVMKAILKAPVELMFFGGIGTYVRASAETDEAVGDRANDAIRVTGADLRCKVIGEGANLGMTQRGRVEAAMRGVRLNTDAIDNSAGVNTSDLEVNIKIALADADARRAAARATPATRCSPR